MEYTLNIRGRLVSLREPQVMGILNATPDSFFEGSRKQTEREIAERTQEIIEQGGSMIDVGAYSTRPGATDVPEEEEMQRLRLALQTVRGEAPDAIVSVDTFRPDVARMAVEEYGADIINDVSEGENPAMFRMVARLGTPYILMSVQKDLRDTLMAFARKVQLLRDLGQKDIILDPGFGFGKTTEENFLLMQQMEKLQALQLPLLVGISRKSMIWKTLGTGPAEALNGTTVLNTLALMKGAAILRVHDVKEAMECCKLWAALAPIG
ncbi:MAG: dihydropteroate synthase [Prevotella sp.]|nr:dihydropteroate synthase [Prevotella sp.]